MYYSRIMKYVVVLTRDGYKSTLGQDGLRGSYTEISAPRFQMLSEQSRVCHMSVNMLCKAILLSKHKQCCVPPSTIKIP
jgi:hypothetical protein